MNLTELRTKAIAKITEELDELSPAQLNELRELEQAAEAPRSTLVKLIDDKLAELAAGNAQSEPAASAPNDAAPDWQAPDYCGPLDGGQAEWRNAHINRLSVPATK